MYREILRKIPLPFFIKIILVLLILITFTLLCFMVIFPFVANFLPYPFGLQGLETGL